ncbi:helicase domain protein, partial [mine drainage metagenome]
MTDKAEIRRVNGNVPQGTLILLDRETHPQLVVQGSLSFTTDGLGITPGNPLSLIQTFDMPEEMRQLKTWFDVQWLTLPSSSEAKRKVVETLQS